MAAVFSRGGRGGRRRPVSEINVVPYIDVMLVLLVIFMVTAPMLPPGVVDLPSAGRSNQRPDAYVEVILTASGEMKVRARNRGDSPEMTIGRRELADAIRSVGGAELPVVISGDRQVRYEAVIDVMTELQKMNITRIALMVQPAGSGR
ncbi:MAG: protein TolR [Betaproteobacteria bacterium]|nr:protein TolR [Betaproteobacteria bacterium]